MSVQQSACDTSEVDVEPPAFQTSQCHAAWKLSSALLSGTRAVNFLQVQCQADSNVLINTPWYIAGFQYMTSRTFVHSLIVCPPNKLIASLKFKHLSPWKAHREASLEGFSIPVNEIGTCPYSPDGNQTLHNSYPHKWLLPTPNRKHHPHHATLMLYLRPCQALCARGTASLAQNNSILHANYENNEVSWVSTHQLLTLGLIPI